MNLTTKKVIIKDGATKHFPLCQGQETLFINPDGTNIGSFRIQSECKILAQKGLIVLEGVPYNKTTLFVDVNYDYGNRLQVLNDTNRDESTFITFKNEDELTLLVSQNGGIFRAKPFTASWDVIGALEDQDVRVTVNVTPMPEIHGIVVSFTTTPLAEALEADKRAKRDPFFKFIDKIFKVELR